MTAAVQNAMWGMYQGLNNVRDDATRRRAGQAIAGGDLQGGAQQLLSGGMLSDGLAVQGAGQDQDRQERADQLTFIREAATMLRGVRDQSQGDPNALNQAFDSFMPVFTRMPGVDQGTIDQYRQAIIANPALLDQMIPQLEYEIMNLGDGQTIAIDPRNPRGFQEITPARPDNRITMTPWGPMGSPEALSAFTGAAQGGGGPVAYDPSQWRPETPANPSQPGAGQPRSGATPALETMVGITAQAESGNRSYDDQGRLITSPAGAQGRMQVMPGTNRDPGFGVTPARDNSEAERIRVGRDYLAAMMRRYGNDPARAWAAYNWGPGNLDNAIARHGDNWLTAAPAETRNYVRRNLSALGR